MSPQSPVRRDEPGRRGPPVALPRRGVTLQAPAKLNLFLRVQGRRPDGYHPIDSLLVPLELADTLTLRLAPRRGRAAVSCRCPGHPDLDDLDNLAARAARALMDAGRLDLRVELTLHKRIPVAAGLGGGSSDAAAVLRGLGRTLHLPEALVRAVAPTLGADVPFFLYGRPARVGGIGHHVVPLSGLPALDVALANPGVPLATARVYRALDRLETRRGARRSCLRAPPTVPTGTAIQNDLEPIASALVPQVTHLRALFEEAGALGVGLSGSGPTVFGLFEDASSAAAAADKVLKIEGFWACASRTVAA